MLLVIHGVAHLPGFAVPWRLMSSPELRYRTTVFSGAIEVGDIGARILGAGWLILAFLFLAIGVATWLSAPWSRAAMPIAVLASTAFCVAGWPEARLGLLVNATLAAAMFTVPR